MRKAILHIFLATVVSIQLYAQQTESYTMYILNQYALNPAYGGTGSCGDFKFGTRLQWVGFEGRPMTTFLTYHTPVGYRNESSKSWHGLGVYVVDDRLGVFKSTSINPSYAFHLRLAHRLVASAGFFVGIKNYSIGGAGGAADPLLTLSSHIMFPDFGAGILLYNPEFIASLSIKQVYSKTLTSAGLGTGSELNYRARQYYLTLAKWFEAPALMFSYTPSVHVKYQESVYPSVDLSVMFHYAGNKFNLGGSYRVGDGIAALIQFNLIKKLSVGYAYEYPLSKINKGTRQTHEIMFKWDPCWSTNDHFGGVDCPAF